MDALLDKMAEALRGRVPGTLFVPWSELSDSSRDWYREDVRMILRMAAGAIDASPVGELYGAASAARLLREISGDLIETPIPIPPSRMRAGRSTRNKS